MQVRPCAYHEGFWRILGPPQPVVSSREPLASLQIMANWSVERSTPLTDPIAFVTSHSASAVPGVGAPVMFVTQGPVLGAWSPAAMRLAPCWTPESNVLTLPTVIDMSRPPNKSRRNTGRMRTNSTRTAPARFVSYPQVEVTDRLSGRSMSRWAHHEGPNLLDRPRGTFASWVTFPGEMRSEEPTELEPDGLGKFEF